MLQTKPHHPFVTNTKMNAVGILVIEYINFYIILISTYCGPHLSYLVLWEREKNTWFLRSTLNGFNNAGELTEVIFTISLFFKPRPFKYLVSFWYTIVQRCNGNFFHRTADQFKIKAVMSLVERILKGWNFRRTIVRLCAGKFVGTEMVSTFFSKCLPSSTQWQSLGEAGCFLKRIPAGIPIVIE